VSVDATGGAAAKEHKSTQKNIGTALSVYLIRRFGTADGLPASLPLA
jgi:hypothetical protein